MAGNERKPEDMEGAQRNAPLLEHVADPALLRVHVGIIADNVSMAAGARYQACACTGAAWHGGQVGQITVDEPGRGLLREDLIPIKRVPHHTVVGNMHVPVWEGSYTSDKRELPEPAYRIFDRNHGAVGVGVSLREGLHHTAQTEHVILCHVAVRVAETIEMTHALPVGLAQGLAHGAIGDVMQIRGSCLQVLVRDT